MKLVQLLSVVPLVLAAGCFHRVGGPEVITRAIVDLDCDADHVYAQSLARDLYEAAGCGKRAVFACSDGACRLDSQISDADPGSSALRDGAGLHQALDAARDTVRACSPELPVEVTVWVKTNGRSKWLYHHRNSPGFVDCMEQALNAISLPTPTERTTFVRYVFDPRAGSDAQTSGGEATTPQPADDTPAEAPAEATPAAEDDDEPASDESQSSDDAPEDTDDDNDREEGPIANLKPADSSREANRGFGELTGHPFHEASPSAAT